MSDQAAYNYKVIRQFSIMTVVSGVVGMLVGVIIAAQLIWPELNLAPWLSYGRLRPLRTNAVIFAFGGSALFATSYYVVQRTCHVRLFGDVLAAFTFWGWQAIIVLAAVTLPLGYTTGKEYAELEWPIDILITLVWVAYAVVFFGTIARRRIQHIYVANWFYGAFILTVALLHVVNSVEIPVTWWKSYPVYAGVQDAMVQWWYGHNAVGLFLTAGFLGIMYYFIPKQAERPEYSYRLSVVHFWALIFTYMWAGPLTVIVASVFTLWLAVRSEDGLVADDYYKRGLAINQTLARAARWANGSCCRTDGRSADPACSRDADRPRYADGGIVLADRTSNARGCRSARCVARDGAGHL